MSGEDDPHAEGAWVEITDRVDGTRWRVDLGFMASNWTCLWGRGCPGILERSAPELNQGCCSVGAELLDDDEARRVAALGLTLDPARFQHHAEAGEHGVLNEPVPGRRPSTRVVDGACIFLNRPGFDGGEGCALHLAAVDDDESPIDWKPSVCWQLPLKVDDHGDGSKTLRRWRRADWGDDAELAWCCTEPDGGMVDGPSAYVGDRSVVDELADELTALTGTEVMVEIRRRVGRLKG